VRSKLIAGRLGSDWVVAAAALPRISFQRRSQVSSEGQVPAVHSRRGNRRRRRRFRSLQMVHSVQVRGRSAPVFGSGNVIGEKHPALVQ
jgi:hypothetical protein